jgi:uncharacterized protein (DUF1778 family)
MSKTEVMRLRLSAEEKEAFEAAAELSGIALSAWSRERLRRAASRELVDAGQQVPFLQKRTASDG